MKQYFRIFAGILILFSATAVFSQTESERLTDASQTYSFLPPAGWNSNADSEGFGLVNPQKTIVLAIKAHSYANFAAFAADANLDRDGVELVGEPIEISGGTAFRTTKQTPKGVLHIGTCVMFSENGGGMMIVALSNEANAVAALEAGWNVSKTVQFYKPKQTAATSSSPLSGKHLMYLYTGNGYSERKDIYLCSSGGFYQSTGMGGFTPNNADGASFGAMGKKHGTWSISGTKLMLKFQNGGTTTYTISKRSASNEIGLNGNRYFVQEQNICQ